MNTQPHKTTRIKIEFQALGMLHTAYCETFMEQRSIEQVVRMITPSAVVISICTDLIDQRTFEEFHITNIVRWKQKIDELEDGISEIKEDNYLPAHFYRCDNSACASCKICKRFLSTQMDVLMEIFPRPDVVRYQPNETECDFFIPKEDGSNR